jgi:DNA polymerase I-like protein with 3'-5' exonuclease and polymerase domains
MRVDIANLERHIGIYESDMHHAESWLREQLGTELNFDADREVAKALLEKGIVPNENWQTTKTGQLSVKKDVLTPDLFTGPNGAQIASALGYRNRLKTCLEMFMKPWLEQASQRNGYISTNWNQTRGTGGGTRTGRPSTSNPNFLNISKTWNDKNDGYVHPEFLEVAPLPLVRRYVLPDDGGVFLHRDFNGQEMRIFGHYECGELKEQYRQNPSLDVHAFVGKKITELTGYELPRTNVKILNFQALYGGGIPAAQAKLRCSLAEAKEYKSFHDQALPGRKRLNEAIKAIVRRGEPIRTWGGRLYYVEPPKEGRSQDYKLINYLIQGSAADITKEALIQWRDGGAVSRFLVTVYDEINISAPIGEENAEMAWLKHVMEQDWLDIKMLSDGKRGPSWGELEKCK